MVGVKAFCFEVCLTALFALIFSYLGNRFVALCLHEKPSKHHPFNNGRLFLTSYFTALMVLLMMRLLNWRKVFSSIISPPEQQQH